MVADFLDVTIDTVLDLYGATCVEQARRVLEPNSGDEGSTTSSGRARSRRHDVAVIERVYFDVAGSSTTPDGASESEGDETWPPREADGGESRAHLTAMTAWSGEAEIGGAGKGQGKRGKGKRGEGKRGEGKRGKGKPGKGKRGTSQGAKKEKMKEEQGATKSTRSKNKRKKRRSHR